MVALGLAGLALWMAAASTPAWSGLPDWRRYNEDHGGILSSPAVLQVVHTILNNGEVQVPWTERNAE